MNIGTTRTVDVEPIDEPAPVAEPVPTHRAPVSVPAETTEAPDHEVEQETVPA